MSARNDDDNDKTGEDNEAKTVEDVSDKTETPEILIDNGGSEETDLAPVTAPDSPILSISGLTPKTSLPPTLQERFLRIKQIVKEAIDSHHTFMIYGRAKVVRECLLKRGWIEKFCRRNSIGDRARYLQERATRRSRNSNFTADSQQDSTQPSPSQQPVQPNVQSHVCVDTSPVVLLSGIGDLRDEQSQRLLMSKMLANHTVDFLWNSGSEWPGWPSQDNKTTIFNRYSRAGFTSKVGLCANVRQMHWYYEPGVANTLFPRCYNICQTDHMHAFIEDFRLTACLSILKWFLEKVNNEGENVAISSTGTVPLKALDFAIRRCSDYIDAQSHEDIDKEGERVWTHQWDQFITWYYKIVHEEEMFFGTNISLHKYLLAAKHILKRMRKYWHQLDMDGVANIWILKPGNKSRGRGIVLTNKIEDVIAKVNPANKSDTRYVVQKYIERPLLIHSTKFDIRQWFIVTCAQPLTLWVYRESYLRFCSQQFRLSDLHESVHLSNHAVQCKYKNSPDRNAALPLDNMWDATTFKHFLKSQGHAEAWDEMIYPGMKQGLVGSLLASQEAMDRRRNSFELYGADFMVMEDFSVWLIEINSHPDMSYSTSVTTRLCKQVMEDVIKVVVDFREDKNADTGLFELAYKQKMPNCQPYLGAALSVHGTRINSNERKLNSLDSRLMPKFPLTCMSRKKSTSNSYIGPVIVDLIEELEIQLDRELHAYCKLDSPIDSNNSSPIISSPILSSSRTSLALIHGKIEATPSGSIIPGSSRGPSPKAKSPTPLTQANPPKSSRITNSPIKSPNKLKRIAKELSPVRQNLVPKITRSQREQAKTAIELRSSTSDKNKNQSEEKLIGVAMRNAMNKYKKYGATPIEVPPLPSLLVPGKTGSRMARSSSVSRKSRHFPSRIKKIDTPSTGQMYAVGLGLTK